MYADTVTRSMKSAMEETERRRAKQIEYNREHNITPRTIIKAIPDQTASLDDSKVKSSYDISVEIVKLKEEMARYSEELDFEHAIECRDRLKRLEKQKEMKDGRK